MRLTVLCLTIAVLTCGCRKASDVAPCPELDLVVARNPVVDADTAFARHDRRVFEIMHGYAPFVPGIDWSGLSVRRMAGTSDNEGKRCDRFWRQAIGYAERYNKRMFFLIHQSTGAR